MKNDKQMNATVAQKSSPKYFLKKVIRRLPQKTKPSNANTVVTKYPLKAGIMGLLGKKEIKYFEIANNTDNRNYAESKQDIVIDDFDTGMHIIISLRYRLSCPAGKEEQLTEFLGAGESAETFLCDFIDKLTHQFYNENLDDFVIKLEENLQKLSLTLNTEIEKLSGLKFISKVSLKNADKVKDVTLSDNIKVVPKGMERWIAITIQYVLKIENNNIAALHMNNKTSLDDIQAKIREGIITYISAKVEAHKLFFHFMNKEKELVDLTNELNQLLLPFGRTIHLGKMVAENVWLKPFTEVEIENKRTPVDRAESDSIVIKNRLQFELSDAGKYLESRMPNLKEWAKKELSDIFALKVFEWEYIDFLVNFEELKLDMEKTMREKASKIGYKINQIISEPKLDENAFLRMDTHTFEYKKLATEDSGITADFSVTVTFMLNNKQAFRELLKYDDNAKESLRKLFDVELKKVLSYETPERIFLQYYNDSFQGANESLKINLENKVRIHLEDRLDATVQDINIVPVDNGLLEPLHSVRGKSSDIELALAPKIEGDPIIYKATLVVHGQDNNNWSQLIEGNYSMQTITQLVIRTLQSEFNMLSEDELGFKSLEHRRAIEKIADKLAKEAVSKRFGLIVEIENLDRNKNSEESFAHRNKKRQLEYKYNQKDSNLQFLAERNMQDREQMLQLSSTMDDEDKAEMEEYAKRVGIEEIEISESSEEENVKTSGLMQLAQETQSMEYLGTYRDSLLNLEKPTDKKKIKSDNQKDEDNQ